MLGQLLVNSLTLGSIYALTALGFAVIYRATGVVNFAQGELMMLGALIALFLFRDLHFGYSLSFLLAIVACMVLGFAIERIAFRPLIHAPHFTVLLSTIAVAQIIRSGVRAFYGQELSLFPSAFSTEPFTVLNVRLTPLNLGVFLVSTATLAIFAVFFSRTRIGWAMRSTAQNTRGATIVGVDVPNVYSVTWAIAGGLAAIGGILLAPLIIITPDMGMIGNKGFIAAILGGFSSLPGAVVGGLILGVAENLVGVYVSSAFKDAIVFMLLVVMLAVYPTGLLGRKSLNRV